MELYVLDSLLRRTAVIDSFESLVWTERFNDLGDMTLNIHSTRANRNLLPVGTLIAMNRSNRVMKVDTSEDKTQQDGSRLLVVTGSSLEIVLDDRVARDNLTAGTTDEPKWVITGLPADTARLVFKNIMVDGILDSADVLPFYADGNLYPADTIPEPDQSVDIPLDPGSVLDAERTICQTYDLGFRLCRNADHSQLFFNVYSGNDRTTRQDVFPAVIFAPNLDNLLDSSYLISNKQYKNVAYVLCPDGAAKVYDTGIDPTVTGFQRRVLLVNASDVKFPDRTTAGDSGNPAYTVTDDQAAAVKAAQTLSTTTQLQSASLTKITGMKRLLDQDVVNINAVLTLTGTTLTSDQIADITAARDTSLAYNPTEDAALNALLTARGFQELQKNNNITAFDGEIPQTGSYKYNFDYFLGDIVEIHNDDGIVNNVRVTEQIFSQDSSGEKSYPTLSSRLVITPGVWAAWDANQQWADVPDTEHWADLPD
jgi:hypothetical protein